MKHLLLLAICFSLTVTAQIETPQLSPLGKVEQKVGLTNIVIEYSRPSMRGRTIFGDLISYGKIWRTGANANTTISFSTDVLIEGQKLKTGSYAVYTIPNPSSWEIIFYSDTNNWGVPAKWDESKVAAKVVVPSYNIPVNVETLTLGIDDITSNSAVFGILWERIYAGVKIEVPTDEIVMKAIEKEINGPDFNDYYAAAVYYLEEGKDIVKAKEWIDKAMALNSDPKFYQLRRQALIYAKFGDVKGAIEIAKKSLEGAEKAGNDDYIKMNKESLKQWEGM